MTTFYLIRHAEKDAPEEMLVGRMSGIGLSARGRVQAYRIARRLAREPIEHIVSSPLERARETAAPLAGDKRLQIDVSEAINEIEFGAWTGKTLAALESDSGWATFNRVRSIAPVPGGELFAHVQARFVGEMLRLSSAFPNGGVAMVSHGDPIKAAILFLLGAPLDFYTRMVIDVGSVSVVTLDEFQPRVLRLNEVPPAEPDECEP